MLYKLLIADDEEHIREGIANIVDWKSMGYEVVGKVCDGKEALEFIDHNDIDVLLTDIKMTFVSGLQLAKHIYESHSHIKVVLISGFREFEFVKEALAYNVVDYLLKPTDLDEISRIFTELKTKMDSEREQEIKDEREFQQYKEMVPLLQAQFFTDLVMSVIRSEEDIRKRMELLGITYCHEHAPCSIIDIEFCGYDGFLNSNWQYGKDSFNNVIRNIFKNQDGLQVYLICQEQGKVKLLIIDTNDRSPDKMKNDLDHYLDRIKQSLESLFKLIIKVENIHVFSNIFEIIDFNRRAMLQTAGCGTNTDRTMEHDDLKKLMEQKKLFMSYVNGGNSEAVHNILDSFFDELKHVDFQIIQNFLIDLFGKLVNEISGEIIGPGEVFNYTEMLALVDPEQLKNWCHHQITVLMGHLEGYSNVSEKNVIRNAKTFINDNIYRDISLEDVAEYVFLNANYFSRLFKKETGENFSDYVVRVKVEKAKELLKDPRYKVYEVSSALGYKNTKYFYKLFKKATGMTPSEYRDTM